jgi:hypothetical protein
MYSRSRAFESVPASACAFFFFFSILFAESRTDEYLAAQKCGLLGNTHAPGLHTAGSSSEGSGATEMQEPLIHMFAIVRDRSRSFWIHHLLIARDVIDPTEFLVLGTMLPRDQLTRKNIYKFWWT